MPQLALPFLESEHAEPGVQAEPAAAPIAAPRERAQLLAAAIREVSQRAVTLHVTDNKRVLISQRREGERLLVRLHHVFLRAEPAVVRALASYVHRRDARSGALVDAFISREQDYLRRSRGRHETETRPLGRVHDLSAILAEVAGAHFEEALELPRITWGKRSSGGRGKRRSILLGTYDREEALIRVHPALDREWVPASYVGFIVYHELLHHLIPPVEKGGRLHVHTAEFRRLERCFSGYEAARRFERENLNRILQERS